MRSRPGELDLGPTTMAAMMAAWALTYVLTRLLLPARSKDFCNRSVSLIHIGVSMYFGNNSVGDWSRPLDGVGAASTYPQVRLEFGVWSAVLGQSVRSCCNGRFVWT